MPADPDADNDHSANCPPPVDEPTVPIFKLPLGACDAHCHVFGPRGIYPYSNARTFTPVDAPSGRLHQLHDQLGFSRTVIVQSSCYGGDHRALLDALHVRGEAARGVAILSDLITDAQLTDFHAAGIRAHRVNLMPHLGLAPARDEILRNIARAGDLGWHTELHVAGEGLIESLDLIDVIPGTVVIDHLSRPALESAREKYQTDALLDLAHSSRVWIKLSGIDRISRSPSWSDGLAFARKVISVAPDRAVWGTDFPHVNISGAAPDDGALLNSLLQILPSSQAVSEILVSNPARLYGFAPVSGSEDS